MVGSNWGRRGSKGYKIDTRHEIGTWKCVALILPICWRMKKRKKIVGNISTTTSEISPKEKKVPVIGSRHNVTLNPDHDDMMGRFWPQATPQYRE